MCNARDKSSSESGRLARGPALFPSFVTGSILELSGVEGQRGVAGARVEWMGAFGVGGALRTAWPSRDAGLPWPFGTMVVSPLNADAIFRGSTTPCLFGASKRDDAVRPCDAWPQEARPASPLRQLCRRSPSQRPIVRPSSPVRARYMPRPCPGACVTVSVCTVQYVPRTLVPQYESLSVHVSTAPGEAVGAHGSPRKIIL